MSNPWDVSYDSPQEPKKDPQSWRTYAKIAGQESTTLRASVTAAEAAIERINQVRDITPEAKSVRISGARAKVQAEARRFIAKHHALRHKGLPGAVDRMMPKRPSDAAESIFKLRELDQMLALPDSALAKSLRDDPDARGLLFGCANKSELAAVSERVRPVMSLDDVRSQAAHDVDPAQARDVEEAISSLDNAARVAQDILADSMTGKPMLTDEARVARSTVANNVRQSAVHHWRNPEWSAETDIVWSSDTERAEATAAATPEPGALQV